MLFSWRVTKKDHWNMKYEVPIISVFVVPFCSHSVPQIPQAAKHGNKFLESQKRSRRKSSKTLLLATRSRVMSR